MSLLVAKRVLLSQPVYAESSCISFISRSGSTKANNDHEYIQRSKVPTMHFQPSLPRLPIPKLEDTCRRYLNAQKPILTDEQMKITQSNVDKFLKNEGVELNNELISLDNKNKHTSYISEPWFDMYLRDRRPLPINYNPFLVFSPETDSNYDEQLIKATNLVLSSMRFLKSLRANLLEPEVFHMNPKKSDTQFFRTFTKLLPSSVSWYGAYLMNAYPLDMSQYKNLFNSTRIPKIDKDEIVLDTSAKHIVVLRNGHFYSFDVLDKNGNIISPLELASNIKYILEDQTLQVEASVGVLTASNRNTWASARVHIKNTGNQNILKKIDSAAFVLILEDEVMGQDQDKLLRTFLYGKPENRWFDKSLSLIVTKDGFGGINFEHSWGDGVAVLRYFQDIKKDISEKPLFRPEDKKQLSTKTINVERHEFILDEKSTSIILEEKSNFDKWVSKLDIDFLIYEGFGKKECKNFGVSPDAVMQFVFQLALFKQEFRSVGTYESCSTSAFKHGRTETVRSCTQQTKNLCSAMAKRSSDVSVAEIKKMIVDCSAAHMTLVKEAAMGKRLTAKACI